MLDSRSVSFIESPSQSPTRLSPTPFKLMEPIRPVDLAEYKDVMEKLDSKYLYNRKKDAADIKSLRNHSRVMNA